MRKKRHKYLIAFSLSYLLIVGLHHVTAIIFYISSPMKYPEYPEGATLVSATFLALYPIFLLMFITLDKYALSRISHKEKTQYIISVLSAPMLIGAIVLVIQIFK